MNFSKLDQHGNIMAEYIWTDGDQNLRSKVRTLPESQFTLNASKLPQWDFDGSSTGHSQSEGPEGTDVYLLPQRVFLDPFHGGKNILVLCDTHTKNFQPHKFNKRFQAAKFAKMYESEKFWFGMEQEYSFIDVETDRPYGWPKGGFPAPQGPYYCGQGAEKIVCRQIVEAHYKTCLYSNIKISGINAEVMPAQWEFQIGPCTADEMGDHLWIARFLLLRVAESFNVKVTFHPKVLQGEWNGAGLHTNVSTENMRSENGLSHIQKAIQKLEKNHAEHMLVYGAENKKRLIGKLETSGYDKFNWGVAERIVSIRIPAHVAENKCGYFEDRRPASNADPYEVIVKMMKTICEP